MSKRSCGWIFVAVLPIVACSSSSSGGTQAGTDAGKTDSGSDAGASTCGQPGDVGNELGIGKYCNLISDCSGTPQAHVCSILGDPTTHFCTKTCTPADAGDAGDEGCGTGAKCECSSQGCGCTPTVCL